jgi:AcrR family transcriptional regulator
VAHGLISYHFGGKNGVFSAAVIETWREIIEFERPREDEVGAAARIYGSLCRHFEQVRADPRRMRLLRAGSREEEVRQFVKAARHEAVLELTAYLGCPLHPPAKLRAALFGWSGYLDGVTLDWEENEDLDLDFVTGLCVQSLVTAVRSASGLSYDPVTEIAALELVSGPPRSPARDAI